MNPLPEKNFTPGIADTPDGLQLAFFKCKPLRGGLTWIAWASLMPMIAESAVMEPAEPLWFNFGANETEAIALVKALVESQIGKTEWWRQKA